MTVSLHTTLTHSQQDTYLAGFSFFIHDRYTTRYWSRDTGCNRLNNYIITQNIEKVRGETVNIEMRTKSKKKSWYVKRVVEWVGAYYKKNISDYPSFLLFFPPCLLSPTQLHLKSLSLFLSHTQIHTNKQTITYTYSVLPFLIFYHSHFLLHSFFSLLSSPSVLSIFFNLLTHSPTHPPTLSHPYSLTLCARALKIASHSLDPRSDWSDCGLNATIAPNVIIVIVIVIVIVIIVIIIVTLLVHTIIVISLIFVITIRNVIHRD